MPASYDASADRCSALGSMIGAFVVRWMLLPDACLCAGEHRADRAVRYLRRGRDFAMGKPEPRGGQYRLLACLLCLAHAPRGPFDGSQDVSARLLTRTGMTNALDVRDRAQ